MNEKEAGVGPFFKNTLLKWGFVLEVVLYYIPSFLAPVSLKGDAMVPVPVWSPMHINP